MKYSNEEKAMWIEDWKQSGKSAWAYAKENGLSPQTFVNWTQVGEGSKQGLVEVPAQLLEPIQKTNEILIEKGSIRIHVPVQLNSSELKAIIAGLGIAL